MTIFEKKKSMTIADIKKILDQKKIKYKKSSKKSELLQLLSQKQIHIQQIPSHKSKEIVFKKKDFQDYFEPLLKQTVPDFKLSKDAIEYL